MTTKKGQESIPKLIKLKRLALGESQAEFAIRFNSHANTVSRWESGQYQAPYEVIEFVLTVPHIVICPTCNGSGFMEDIS